LRPRPPGRSDRPPAPRERSLSGRRPLRERGARPPDPRPRPLGDGRRPERGGRPGAPGAGGVRADRADAEGVPAPGRRLARRARSQGRGEEMIRSVVTRGLWGLALAAFAPPARAAEVPGAASPLPALTLPAPTGREAIGTITVDLTIPEREEVFTERAGDARKVVLQLWYPAARTRHCARAPYMDPVTARTAVDSAGLPSGFQDRIATHACTGAPPARHPRRWPVILFSHGLGATRFGYATLFEDLASRG